MPAKPRAPAATVRPDGVRRRPPTTTIWICVGLFVLIQLVACVHFARFAPIDDAFIAFRYAANFAGGDGLVFNPGERVEGYTCFLWVVLLAPFAALRIDPVVTSRILGAVCLALTLLVLTRFSSEELDRPAWSVLIAPLLLATSAPSALWAVHGLETPLFTLLLTLAVLTDARDHGGAEFVAGWSAVWYALASLTRPEGLAIFAASALFWAASGPRRLTSWPFLRHVLQFATLVLPHELWRYMYYGELLPNTFYVKVSLSAPLVARGARYVLHFFGGAGALLLVAFIPLLFGLRRHRWEAFLSFTLLVYLATVAVEGGDAFPAFRFILPICPLIYLLVQDGVWRIVQLSRTQPRLQLLAAVAVLLTAVGAVAQGAAGTFEAGNEARGADSFTGAMIRVGLALRDRFPSSTRIALNPAGAVPYYSGFHAYDMLGLTDRHIAHTRAPQMGTGFAGHEKGDGKYILDRAPDIILFGNVQISPKKVDDPTTVRWSIKFRSEKDISQDPRTTQLYVPDQLSIGGGAHLLYLSRR